MIFTMQQLSSKELYELKKKQKEEARKKEARMAALSQAPKKIGRYFLYGGVAVLVIGSVSWFITNSPSIPETEIISKRGIHWHADLAIYVKGVKQEIPTNVGLGVVHNPIHTHDSDNVIHMEFPGLVRKDDLKLGRFFKVWGKDLMDFGSSVKMLVNGKENTELADYVMRDGDKIELRYE